MNEIALKENNFNDIYQKSYRLAGAVFLVSNTMEQDEELKTKIKKLSLNLVSLSVSLKDISILDAKKILTNIEKISLELMSLLDIAAVSGLVSKMNGDILKEEFQSFVLELNKFSEAFENSKNVSVKGILSQELKLAIPKTNQNSEEINMSNGDNKDNGHKRKNLRRNTILDFIKGHNNANIKDIALNINGCSEKTIQRELVSLINGGKIKKSGERRWSRYSIA